MFSDVFYPISFWLGKICFLFIFLIFISQCQSDDSSEVSNPEIVRIQVQLESITLRLSKVQQLYDVLYVQNQEQSKVLDQQVDVLQKLESDNKKQKEELDRAGNQLEILETDTKQNEISIKVQKERILDLDSTSWLKKSRNPFSA